MAVKNVYTVIWRVKNDENGLFYRTQSWNADSETDAVLGGYAQLPADAICDLASVSFEYRH